MSKLLYKLFLKSYALAARLISPFNSKAKLWLQGRKELLPSMAREVTSNTGNRIWIHCSSLGEFEQGRPLMEALRNEYPRYQITLTFFSPSGYEHEKNYQGADHIFYLPVDSEKNAKRLFDILQPALVIFIKYEFWYYYLAEAKNRKIPLLLVSGIFREDQPFFKWYGSLHRQMLSCFSMLFVQNETSRILLQSININHVVVAGDTRFDRVLEIARHFEPVVAIDRFCDGKKVIVAGSTWLDDDEELDHYANTHGDYRFIIAPHDIGEARLLECEKLYHRSIRYSRFLQLHAGADRPNGINTLIIDNIGMLKYLYRYGDACYVGGGFGGDGVHNVLEAAVYDRPVIFGPIYDKFEEAVELIDAGGAYSVTNALELEERLDQLLSDNTLRCNTSTLAGEYVRAKAGATARVMEFIHKNRLLTS